MATYWVTESGGGALNGSTLADALPWATFVTNFNAATAGGDDWLINGTVNNATLQTLSCAAPNAAPHRIMGAAAALGDWDQGYAATGQLNTTNFATLAFSTTSGRLVVSGTNILLYGLNVTGVPTNVLFNVSGQGSKANRCRIENSSTGASATATNLGHVTAQFRDCDILQSAASGANPAATWSTAACYYNCRVKSVNGGAFYTTYGFGQVAANRCVAYDSVRGFEFNTTAAGAFMLVSGCTVRGHSSSGISIASGATGLVTVEYSHITDNGAYGINDNGATALALVLHRNRYRDNASGNLSVAARASAVEYGAVTTDTGGAATDYVDVAGGDLRLIYQAPGVESSDRGVSIGACDPVQTAPGAGSGGGARRVVFVPLPVDR